VKAKGFLRNQIRMMMGALFCLGKGEISLEQLALSLQNSGENIFCPMAPAAGLILNTVQFESSHE
jgi:tRNA pseudouridine38-40 synthase